MASRVAFARLVHVYYTPVKPDSHAGAVAARFSAAAGTYESTARLQSRVALELMNFLNATDAPRSILEIGCGVGVLTGFIAARFRSADITAIDIAPNSIAIARRKFEPDRRISFHIADAMTYSPGRQYDMILSSSTFQWLIPQDRFLMHAAELLKPGGKLVFSMMVDGTLAELHDSRHRAAPGKSPMSSMPGLDSILKALRDSGLTTEGHRLEDSRGEYPSANALLRSLHDTGVTGGALSTSGVSLTRKELCALVDDYTSRYSCAGGGVYATYRVLYVAASRRTSE